MGARALRCERVQLAKERERLESLSRVLDSISYRAVLERGFALVRGADGKIRRRAADIKAGEALHSHLCRWREGRRMPTVRAAAAAKSPPKRQPVPIRAIYSRIVSMS